MRRILTEVLHMAVTEPLWTSILVSLAPVVVALVALGIGTRQQNKTLRISVEQQNLTLRQQARQDDLREARNVLDDAARALQVVQTHHRSILVAAGDREYDRGRLPIRLSHDPGRLEALRSAVNELSGVVASRIEIRFGADHRLTQSFGHCVSAALEMNDAVDQGRVARINMLEEVIEDFVRAGRIFGNGLGEWISLAVSYTGVDLDAREVPASHSANLEHAQATVEKVERREPSARTPGT